MSPPPNRRRRPARPGGARGATAVELALVLPVLVVLLFGIVQFSISYNQKQGLHAAAREGARFASLPSSTATEIEARVHSALAGVAVTGTPTVVITPAVAEPCRDRSGQPVVVEVRSAEQLSVPFVMERSVTLTGRGEFRCE
jgi:hypothetical protein